MIIKNLFTGLGDEYDYVTYPGDEQSLMDQIARGEFLTHSLENGKEIRLNPAYIISFEVGTDGGLRVV